MAVPPLAVLAAVASLDWPVWAGVWLLLLFGAFWFSQPADDRASDDHGTGGGGGQGGSRAEDAARIRELQDTVDELTRLRAAALDAAQRRDEFVTMMSHELRSPLNAILGWTQVLQPRADLPDDVRDALGVIRRNALRQRQLLDDLVDLSRVVSGALRIEPRPMRVQDALDEACQSVAPELQRKGIRLDCGSSTDAVVSGDARRLQQVLRNLLANAVRFTPSGGAVTIRAATIGSEVSIGISDTGSGIEPAFLPHVFEPFRQQPGAKPPDQATFGLGLALARIIVAGHGGRMLAQSDGPGRGSTFTVILPTLPIDQGAAGTSAEVADRVTHAPLAGVRVLAVDDEPDWRELLGHILGAAGAEARIAASAAEAIQIFEAWRPDVVLTDIAMPVTDGYGLLSSIRGRGGAGRAVPAIAMTAHAGVQERTRTARAGFAEHLAKPIPPHELIDAVRRVADQSLRAKGVGSA
jgi:signal transduction histidine kinase/ActR/RegA family two-component response regulator